MKKWIKALIIVGIVLALGGILTFIIIRGLNTVKPGENNNDDIALEEYLEFIENDDETGLIVRLKDYRDTPEKVTIPEEYNNLPIVEIEDGGFAYCTNIKELVLPKSITKIGRKAFSNCRSLESITLPFIGQTLDGGDKFAVVFDESGINPLNVTILDGTKVERSTFSSCSFIKSISLPSSITALESSAFSGASNLEKITFEVDSETSQNALTLIGNEAFSGCKALSSIEIPLSVTSIGEKAFYNCAKINAISIPSSVEVIRASTFENCTALEVVTLRNTLAKIETAAFKNCKALSVISLPDGLEVIEEEVFMNCASLKEIHLSDKIKTIEKNTFKDCSLLNSVELGDGIEIIKESAFDGCHRLLSLSLPKNITTIEKLAFNGCAKIAKLYFPKTLTNLDSTAFSGCIGIEKIEVEAGHPIFKEVNGYLTSLDGTELIMYPNGLIDGCLVIPSEIKVIKAGAFSQTTSLVELVIPATVELIEKGAFVGCTSLEKLTTAFIGTNEKNSKFSDIFDSVPTSLKTLEFTGERIEKGQIEKATSLENITLPFIGTSLLETEDKTFVCIFETLPAALKTIVIKNPDVVVDGSFKNLINLVSVEVITTKLGKDAFFNCPSLVSFNSSENVVNLSGINEIESRAFLGCASIKTVVFDALVNNIKSETFSGCTSLQEINMDNITKIGECAFEGCSSLVEMTLSKDLEMLEEKAFAYCKNLTMIDIPNENPNYTVDGKTILFNKDKTILLTYLNVNEETSYEVPSTIVRIAPYAFAGNKTLEEVVLSDSTLEIGEYAFFGSTQLQNLDLKNVTYVGENALAFCSNLKDININSLTAWLGLSFDAEEQNPLYYAKTLLLNGEKVTEIVIPESISEIKNYAFANCASIEKITLSKNVTKVGVGAFANCANLKELNLNANISYIPEALLKGSSSIQKLTVPFIGDAIKNSSDLYQYPFGYIFGTTTYTNSVAVDQFYYGDALDKFTTTKYYIPKSLKEVVVLKGSINFGAFAGITTINTVTLQDGVTSVGYRAFESCTGLANINFCRGVTSIADYAFNKCTGLKEVFIPKNVLEIKKYSFAECKEVLFRCEAIEQPSGWESDWNSSNEYLFNQKKDN